MKSLGKKPEGARLERMRGLAPLGGRPVSQPAPDHSGPEGPECVDAEHRRVSLRRRAARAERAAAGARSARDLVESARQRAARHLARSFHGALEIDGLRVLTDPVWGPRASPSRFAGPKRFQPVPVRAARDAAARSRGRVARSLRPSRLPDDPRTREARRAVRDIARRRRAPGSLGRASRDASPSSTGGKRYRLPNSALTVTAAPSQHFSGRGLHDRNSTLWSSMVIRSRTACRFSSAAIPASRRSMS